MKHARWRLVTLTFEQTGQSILDTLLLLKHSFAHFARALRRRYPDTQYVRTIEIHNSGYPHIHLVISRYVPQAFLQLIWKRAGGGIADISAGTRCRKCNQLPPCNHVATKRKVTYKDAARYLTDEIEKRNQDPHQLGLQFWMASLRSISLSRTLKLRDPESPWKFDRIIRTEEDMDYYFELTDPRIHPRDAIVPSVAFRGSAALIGPGLKPT
jgi:hypothetical protein